MKSLPFFCALLLAGLTCLVGCKRKESSAGASSEPAGATEKIKIGFLVKQPEEPWFQYEWRGADKAGAQDGFETIKLGVADGEKVMAAIDNIAVAGAKGFVICTPEVQLGPTIMSRAKQKGLKVITVDDQFVSGGKIMGDVPYVGMSASQIGQAQGEALFAEMKKRGWSLNEVGVCAVTFEELDTARERTSSSIAALKAAGFPEAQIFKAPQKTTDIPGSFDAASILLTQKPDVKKWLILGMNDSAVMGAVRAVEARGFGPDTAIGIGINGTDCIDELRKPKPTAFFGSMLVSAPYEGFTSAELLYKWIKDGVQPPMDTRTKGILITRENFEAILKREGIL